MHDTNEIFQLLQIATLAQAWPDLHPLRDQALARLRIVAHGQEKPAPVEPVRRPAVIAPRLTENKNG